MTGRITGCGGSVFDLPPLLSWNLDYTGGVPCDSFSVTFPYENGMAETLRQATGFEAVHQGKIVLRVHVNRQNPVSFGAVDRRQGIGCGGFSHSALLGQHRYDLCHPFNRPPLSSRTKNAERKII